MGKIRRKITRTSSIFIVTMVLMSLIFTSVIAAYTGPANRSSVQSGSTWQRRYCDYYYYNTDYGWQYGFLPRYVAPTASCPGVQNQEGWQTGGGGYAWHCTNWVDYPVTWDNGANRCYNMNNYYLVDYGHGYARQIAVNTEIQSCTSGQDGCAAVAQYSSYGPATVSGTPVCTTPGSNGWCRGGGTLSLSSTEPIPSKTITKIETATTTLCASGACSYTMPEGNNSLTYWAVSSFGDTSSQSTSSMKLDTVAPTASLAITGTQVNGWYNGTVTMTTTGTDATSTVASRGVEINGGAAQTSPYTFTSEGTFSAVGLVTDLAGWETRTASQAVKRDVTKPVPTVLTSEVISASGWYNKSLSVSATATDNASGYDRTAYSLTNGVGAVSSGTLPVTVNVEGTNTLAFTTYDVAGNSVAHNSTIKLDSVPPTSSISIVGPSLNGWYNGALTITTNGTDATSGVASRSVSVDGGANKTSPYTFTGEGTYSVVGVVKDVSGLETISSSSTISRDVTAPVITIHASVAATSSGWYIEPVTISATAADNLSGYDRTEYTLTNGAGVVSTGVLPVLLNVDGTNSISFVSYDVAGNSVSSSATYKLDLVPPTANLSVTGNKLNGWYNGPLTFTTTGTDATSGVLSRTIEVDGGPSQASPYSFTGEGSFSVVGVVKDVAGQETSTSAVTISRDVTYPVVTILKSDSPSSSGWYTEPLVISATATDNASGYDRTEYTLTNGAGDVSTGILPVTLNVNGTNSISFVSYDVAGNSVSSSSSYKLDLVPPTANLSFVGSKVKGWYNSDLTITSAGTDATSGVFSRTIEVDGGSAQTSPLNFTGEGTFSVVGVVKDVAGLETSTSAITISRDVTDPVITILTSDSPSFSGWYLEPLTISASATDNASGYDRTEYTLTNGAGVISSGELPLTLKGDGTNDLSFISYDVAGNSVTSSASYKLDLVPPAANLSFSGSKVNGWYNGALSITTSGSDATSGVFSRTIEVDGGASQASPLIFAEEGVFSIVGVVKDVAGLVTITSAEKISRDVTDPVVTIHRSGSPAASGWYLEPLTITATATDNLSGYDRTEYTLTNGAGSVSNGVLPVTLDVDGVNNISFVSYDVAGNSVTSSASYNIDLTNPTATLIAAGDPPVITLAGEISDSGSGIKSNGLSLDGGETWTPVPVGLGGAWLYTWNTSVLPDGNNALQLRATDNAGRSTVNSLSFVVANYPAQVTLADPWTLPESGALRIVEGGIEYHDVIVTICDPQGRVSCIVRNYSPNDVPSTIQWDGWFGSYEAPAGGYPVTVKVFDNIDRVVIAESEIIVPETQAILDIFTVKPVPETSTPDEEGELIRFFGFVKSFDGAKLDMDGKVYKVTSESILNEANGEVKDGVLVSGTAMSLTNRVVSVSTLSAQLAEGDGIVTFQGVIDYWSEPDDVGDSWMIINDLAYHITSSTSIHGEASEGSYVVGVMENGTVVSMWVSSPDSTSALVEFKGTVSGIVGSADQLPYTLTIGGLNYKVTDESIVSGDVAAVGTFVSGTAMGSDRLVLGMQITTKKPGLWSLALDFFQSSTGGFITAGAFAAAVLTGTGLTVLNKRKSKKAEDQAVDEAMEKLGK